MASQLKKIPRNQGGAFNPRKATAPIAAFVMAVILYTYSVTSIRAAKRNAQLHREADGGQLDMRKESLRRHGVLDKPEGTRGIELFRDARREHASSSSDTPEGAQSGANKAKSLGEPTPTKDEKGQGRTEVESGLEGYKGRGNAVRKFREMDEKEKERE